MTPFRAHPGQWSLDEIDAVILDMAAHNYLHNEPTKVVEIIDDAEVFMKIAVGGRKRRLTWMFCSDEAGFKKAMYEYLRLRCHYVDEGGLRDEEEFARIH